MKLQFKIQPYQTAAVDSVVDCFAGQPRNEGISYLLDPGKRAQHRLGEDAGVRNAALVLDGSRLLSNVQEVQREQNLTPSTSLVPSKAGKVNLDIEMETGTGKTYVYIKTIMELHKRYGWSKYIVVVPSIAIREGVMKTFDITSEHFQENYGTKPRAFIYNSSRLHELETFSSDAGVQAMIINIQAFNSTGKDNRRIYDVLDDFQSRRPIDVIAANRPIVIVDEPQKIGSPKAQESLANFHALFLLRYSATHKVEHNKVHRLDALDAYTQKLVKKIAVRGITVRGLAGSTAYLYLDAIEVKKGAKPVARVELEVQTQSGIKRQVKRVEQGTNLHDLAAGIEAYKPEGKPLIVTDIDANHDFIELSSGDIVTAGQLTADVTEDARRRIQIREVIRAHLEKERELFAQGVKVLSLFFIDEVVKYRDYEREDTLGEYGRVFEEEYVAAVTDYLSELPFDAQEYRDHLEAIAVRGTHQGYFSIDKRTSHQIDGEVKKTGDERGQSTDVDAYDLILKNKERLLSFDEPMRFLFSHSALREGWDNPNVFTMGMLKKSDNTVSRRQEIGRGLRLAVNQQGERMDDPTTVHDVNELTVVTDESYTAFVDGLQKELSDALAGRPRKATEKFFTGKQITTEDGEVTLTQQQARSIYKYLLKNDYVNDDDTISEAYRTASAAGALADSGSPDLNALVAAAGPLITALDLDLPMPEDGRKPKIIPVNENFEKREFTELWNRINHKAIYQVDFDSSELISRCVTALDSGLKVSALQYVVQVGRQKEEVQAEDVAAGAGFEVTAIVTQDETLTAFSQVKYDLIGEVAEKTQLTRRTVADILTKVKATTFAKFRQNPEEFITECARLVNEQKATAIVEHLVYEPLVDRYDTAVFTENQTKQDLSNAGDKLKRHIYDYVVTDSQTERKFVTELDSSEEVVVYAKLPRGFFIPTPLGHYNPDWAVAFKEGTVKHVYFVAETKGSLSSLQLRQVEKSKIECARKFFARLNELADAEQVTYDVVTSYGELRQLVGT
ncbi:restriction endonuclease subunit R [Actinobacteria bacterium SCGC AG-212-D09]|nr:restriction endonuclease subunit R [Actinobacteria bacterium SCGC AG-212-D09]